MMTGTHLSWSAVLLFADDEIRSNIPDTDTTNCLPNGLSQSTVSFFQEYNPAALDLDQDWRLVVERVLRYGNRAELRWLFGRYDRSCIASWVQKMGAARLPRRQLWFWWMVWELEGPVPPRPKGRVWPH